MSKREPYLDYDESDDAAPAVGDLYSGDAEPGADAVELEILEAQRQRLIERIQRVVNQGCPALPTELDGWVGQLVALRIALGVDALARSVDRGVTMANMNVVASVGASLMSALGLAKRHEPQEEGEEG
jgi:hypothetical protein